MKIISQCREQARRVYYGALFKAKMEILDYWLLLAESHLTRHLFGVMLRRIWALPVPAD